MIKQDHLRVYDLTLKAHSPIFIGSGKMFKQHEYCFDSKTNTVAIIDQERFFQLLIERNMVERYETFIFGHNRDLRDFLRRTCNFSPDEIRKIIRYTVNATDALDGLHTLKEIHAFVRTPDGKPYIPGSSIKGALRTALLTMMVLKNDNRSAALPTPQADRKGYAMAALEGQYLNKLRLSTNDAVNSILRGISISDSSPISNEAIILCGKYDASPSGYVHKINLCRECIRPSSEIRFKLTLDTSVTKDAITIETIKQAIREFDRFYCETYLKSFKQPESPNRLSPDCISGQYAPYYIILGGGAGYFSKTIAYQYLGKENGLRYVADFMQHKFRQHHHNLDVVNYKISPHTMKYAKIGRYLHPYGICEVSIE